MTQLRAELKQTILETCQQTTDEVFGKWYKRLTNDGRVASLNDETRLKFSNLRLHIMLDALGMTTQKDWIEYVKSFNNITDLNELQPCLTEINQLRFQFLGNSE